MKWMTMSFVWVNQWWHTISEWSSRNEEGSNTNADHYENLEEPESETETINIKIYDDYEN